MADKPMRGVYPILVTPYDERGQIDVDSLRNLLEVGDDRKAVPGVIPGGVAGLFEPSRDVYRDPCILFDIADENVTHRGSGAG